jgi:hypothetical protein
MLRDAWIDAVIALKQHTKYKVVPRPEQVREIENRLGRKGKKKEKTVTVSFDLSKILPQQVNKE